MCITMTHFFTFKITLIEIAMLAIDPNPNYNCWDPYLETTNLRIMPIGIWITNGYWFWTQSNLHYSDADLDPLGFEIILLLGPGSGFVIINY